MPVIPESADGSADSNKQSSEPEVTVEITTLPDPGDSPAGVSE